MAEKDNLGAALKLARAGFYVFSCRGKIPAVGEGKSWKDESTRDETKIRHMWKDKPGLVAAIDLGKSGHIVIDCDVKGDYPDGVNGKEAFENLFDSKADNRDKIPVVATPSGGIHYYFRQRVGETRGDQKGTLPQGIDVKGSGYVIAPHQVMTDGLDYEYQGKIEDLIKAPVLPDWLADILGEDKNQEEYTTVQAHQPLKIKIDTIQAQAYIKAAIEGEFAKFGSASKGTRNDSLYFAALKTGSMIAGGWISENEALDQLFVMAKQKGLQTGEIKRAIKNGFTNGKRNPRQLSDYITQQKNITPQEEALRQEISNVIYLSFEKKQRTFEGSKSYKDIGNGEFVDEDTGEVVILEPEREAEPEAKAVKFESVQELEYPKGLVGEIARWIVATARYPQPELAIGAALTIVGTAAGRQFTGPTFSGTHLYLLAMAETGTGKDAPLQAIKTILKAAGLEKHLGPDEFASMSSVVGFLKKKPLAVCPMDEFGGFMKRINSKRGSTHENAIPKILRSLWSLSFAPYLTPESVSRESEIIYSPAISIFGATTPEQFYGAMSGAQLEDGTLNRFLLIRGRDEVEEVEPESQASKVPEHIIESLKSIYNYSGETAALWRNDASADPTVEDRLIKIHWCADGAQSAYKEFTKKIAHLRKQNIQAKEFYVRTAEMALRIATIIAIGSGRDHVRREDLEYGIGIAKASADFMVEGAADYMAENDNQAREQKIIRALKQHGGRMSRTALLRFLGGSIHGRDLTYVLNDLLERADVEKQEIKTSGQGRPATYYKLMK